MENNNQKLYRKIICAVSQSVKKMLQEIESFDFNDNSILNEDLVISQTMREKRPGLNDKLASLLEDLFLHSRYAMVPQIPTNSNFHNQSLTQHQYLFSPTIFQKLIQDQPFQLLVQQIYPGKIKHHYYLMRLMVFYRIIFSILNVINFNYMFHINCFFLFNIFISS